MAEECRNARRAPCKECPWKVDSRADRIPNYSPELAENLVNTVGQQYGQPMMACHQSTDENEIHCVGFLAMVGWDNITVRMALVSGQLDPRALEPPPPEWGEMHESFEEMIEKLRETWEWD